MRMSYQCVEIPYDLSLQWVWKVVQPDHTRLYKKKNFFNEMVKVAAYFALSKN